jgi:hypothetical protein
MRTLFLIFFFDVAPITEEEPLPQVLDQKYQLSKTNCFFYNFIINGLIFALSQKKKIVNVMKHFTLCAIKRPRQVL